MDELLFDLDCLIFSYQQTNECEVLVGVLMDTFYTPVYRVVVSILQDSDEADDITQETFITAIDNIDQYQVGTNLKAWLFTLAVNKCRDQLRKNKRRQNYMMVWRSLKTLTNHQTSPEDAAVKAEAQDEIWAAVYALGEKHRLPIILRFIHNMPIREIAHIMNISEGTVHSRLHYAEKKLRHYINPSGRTMQEIRESYL